MNPNDLRPAARQPRARVAPHRLRERLGSAWPQRGAAAAAGVAGSTLGSAMLWGGVVLDLALGLALWRAPLRGAATAALVATLTMTLITSAVLPGLWLDPLGALTKNLPILAALLVLRRNAS